MTELYDQDRYLDLEQNPQLVASEQVRLADEWARVYSNPTQEPVTTAEIILRNPSLYLGDVNRILLPEKISLRWERAEKFADQIVALGQSQEMQWSMYASPIAKVQSLVESGRLDPMVRGAVADLMRMTSDLFSESTVHLPGNTSFYARNIRMADSRLPR